MSERKPWQSFILILWRLSAVVLLLGIASILLIVFPNPVLKPLIVYSINNRIPGEIEVNQLSWSTNQITLKGVTYHGQEGHHPIKAKEIVANYVLQSNYTPAFGHVVTYGLEIPTVYDIDVGLVIEGVPKLEVETQGEEIELPISTIEMHDTVLKFDTPYGNVSIQIDGNAHFTSHDLNINGKGQLISPFLLLEGEVSMKGAYTDIKGELKVDSLKVPQLFTIPVNGSGTFDVSPTHVDFNGAFVNKELGIKFDADMKHDLSDHTSQTKLDFKLPNLKTAMDASVTKLPDIPQLTGGVTGRANFTYHGDKVSGNARVNLNKIGIKDKDYNLQGISGTLNFNNLESFSTPRDQSITIKKLDSFVALENVRLKLQHKGNGFFNVQEVQADFAGGKLRTSPFVFESLKDGALFSLFIKDVPAQTLAKFSKLPDLMVTGYVDGNLLMHIHDHDFAIDRGGRLWVNNPPGIVQYRPEMSKNLQHNLKYITSIENPMNLALIALWNLHYTKLEITMEKPLDKELSATLHIKGKNPEALSGQPFEFNINISGETLGAIKEAMSAMK